MASIRTFIAVKASDRLNRNAADLIERLASTGAQYKWVAEENLHLTLKFVGDVRDTDIPELCKLVKQGTESLPPFDLQLEGVGAFPSLEQPRTIWLGVDEGTAAMQQLHACVEDVLSYWGVNKDRHEFIPHLTLGRLARGGRWNDDLLERMKKMHRHEAGTCHVDCVKVYSSYLDRSGPSYSSMATIKLKGTE